ncbi:hypothetical protein Rhe02_17500 [Rhizocola hellebori]|uniref:WD40 repeat domain-containing protein n=1 Tax=Rhizocola hellebori TaxID=1392758 RepID=A0A8J3Q5J3_9ACTN|nr:hypothetical protein [Rhizocola hellebori]GIH03683.1 hypothetical protein Rhe02_17500 [Rhizocola hellebori]
MNEEDRLSALLRQTAFPPTLLTPGGAVRTARRSLRRRRVTMSAAAAVVAVAAMAVPTLIQVNQNVIVANSPSPLVSPSPTPTPSLSKKAASPWVTEALALPAGIRYASAQTVDATGRYIAGVAEDNRVVLWDNGSPVLLPPIPGRVHDVYARSINSSGYLIGTAEDQKASVEDNYPWLYHDGQMTILAKPKGDIRVQALAINTRGDILGWADNAGPVLWHVSNPGKVTKLSGLDGGSGLGDDGTVGGRIGDGDHPAVRDPSGKVTIVAEAPGRPGGKVDAVAGEWASGWVAGPTPNVIAAKWNLRTGELIQYPQYAGPIYRLCATGAFLSERSGYGGTVFVDPLGNYEDLLPLAEADVAAMLANPRSRYLDANDLSDDGTLVVGTQFGRAGGGEGAVPVMWRLKR